MQNPWGNGCEEGEKNLKQEISDENNFEWACFKFSIENGVERLVYLSPYDPERSITFNNADQFTDMSTAMNITTSHHLDGIITREAVEHLTHITLKHLTEIYSDKHVDCAKAYNTMYDLEEIIDSVKDHYQRVEIAIINDKKRAVISNFLTENFNGEVENKLYTFKSDGIVTPGSYT